MGVKNGKILICGEKSTHKIVVLDSDGKLEDVFIGNAASKSIKSNIYIGTITRIEPSLECVFVDYGGEKAGFLSFYEIHRAYYNSAEKKLSDVLNFNNLEIQNASKTQDEVDESNENDIVDIDKIEFEIDEENAKADLKKETMKHKVQDVMKVGQKLLVQVFRDERGNKGASVTTYITLPSRYFVFTPNNRKLHGVSKRIPDQNERNRLRDAINTLSISSEAGLVVRTAACKVSVENLKKDYESALKSWEDIVRKSLNAKSPGIIMEAESGIAQVIRDVYDNTMRIVVDSNLHEEVLSISQNIGIKSDSIIVYRSETPMLQKFGINQQLMELYTDRADLKSGGYIVINYTEALVAIDVNSGKLNNEKDVERTAFKTNLEAVDVISRQIRLRDIGGLIVIDFIDMQDSENRKAVEMKMRDVLALNDKARIQFTPISPFGLMEVSRQRLRTSFIDTSTIRCNHCNGTGKILSSDLIINEIKSSLRKKIKDMNLSSIKIQCSSQIANKLALTHSQDIRDIETDIGIRVIVEDSYEARGDNFIIFGSSKDNFDNLVEICKSSELRYKDDIQKDNHHNDRIVKNKKKDIKVKKSKSGFLNKIIDIFIGDKKKKENAIKPAAYKPRKFDNKNYSNKGKRSYRR